MGETSALFNNNIKVDDFLGEGSLCITTSCDKEIISKKFENFLELPFLSIANLNTWEKIYLANTF